MTWDNVRLNRTRGQVVAGSNPVRPTGVALPCSMGVFTVARRTFPTRAIRDRFDGSAVFPRWGGVMSHLTEIWEAGQIRLRASDLGAGRWRGS
jgi:hypothetical protein